MTTGLLQNRACGPMLSRAGVGVVICSRFFSPFVRLGEGRRVVEMTGLGAPIADSTGCSGAGSGWAGDGCLVSFTSGAKTAVAWVIFGYY